MIGLSDVQQVAPRVLARLQELVELPQHGVVAGQSVATLVYEELGLPIKGALNDVDVFVARTLPASQRGVVYTNSPGTGQKFKKRASSFTQWKQMSAHKKKVTTDVSSGNSAEDYKFLNIIGQRGTISVLRTYRRDLLNYTLVDGEGIGPSGFVNVQVAQGLVNGFDLNCVAVGIDLHTKRLVCTEDFIEFLNTQYLKPQSYHTPGYTLIRLAKKLFGDKMEGVICDFEQEKTILLAGSSLQQNRSVLAHRDNGHLYTFGPKYRDLLQPFAQHLPAMVEKAHDDITLWSFVNPHVARPQMDEFIQGFKQCAYTNTDFAWGVLYTKHLGKLWNLPPKQRQEVFSSLKNSEADHLEILNMVRPAPQITCKILKAHSGDQMQVMMPNSSLTVEEQDAVVDTYNGWDDEQRNVFHALSGEFHEIPLLEQTPVRFFERKLLEFGGGVFKSLQHQPHKFAEMYPKMLAFAATGDGRNAIRQSWVSPQFNPQYYTLPIPPKDFIKDLIDVALGPDLVIEPTDNTKMANHIMEWILANGYPLPSQIPSLHASRCLGRLAYLRVMETEHYSPHQLNVVNFLLENVEDQDLKTVYVYLYVKTGAHEVLEERLLRMDDQSWEDLKEHNYKKIDQLHGREKIEQLNKTTVLFEKVSLLRAVGAQKAPAKINRRM